MDKSGLDKLAEAAEIKRKIEEEKKKKRIEETERQA